MKKLMVAAVLALGLAGMSHGASYVWNMTENEGSLETWADNNVYIVLQSAWKH